ncbi:hsp90 co-chaperone Cdc37-like 1 isoform X2 [Melanotaenia boesemani]|uniref:hsp90 co-chaperone Cdc37-like 1 isoform X2 n=1 Tax=Melanotaenia boesemani TaxID=1250792 RepID=UPI001C04EEFA|nr:hsp90 co-chaperone Cdc37-like 1 isoform X2 [Melanotaenia boesemani]
MPSSPKTDPAGIVGAVVVIAVMEWLGNGSSLHSNEEPSSDHTLPARDLRGIYPHKQLPSSPLCDCAMASLCQSQQRCVKASIVSSWRLAEAQDQLCSLGVHSSESLEQERARTQACPAELTNTEDEWRRKESMLGGQEPSRSPVLGATGSWDVFDKSIINVQNQPVEMDQDKCKTFLQKYEQELRHFGMLRRWDDSQRFLSGMPQLICEETANFLILWCIRLQQEGKEALMEQVAHQAVVMQFIMEMASNSQQDPRGCFRQFFHKAKDGQDVYLEVFHAEVEAFKQRVKEYTAKCRSDASHTEQHNTGTNYRLDSKEATDLLQQVGDYNMKHCLEAGLWTSTGKWTKDDATETEDILMMETS